MTKFPSSCPAAFTLICETREEYFRDLSLPEAEAFSRLFTRYLTTLEIPPPGNLLAIYHAEIAKILSPGVSRDPPGFTLTFHPPYDKREAREAYFAQAEEAYRHAKEEVEREQIKARGEEDPDDIEYEESEVERILTELGGQIDETG